jgi:hypothetical protein
VHQNSARYRTALNHSSSSVSRIHAHARNGMNINELRRRSACPHVPLLNLFFFFSSFLASSFSTAATQDETTYALQSQFALTALTSSPFFHTSRLALSDNTYRHKAATTRQAYALPFISFYSLLYRVTPSLFTPYHRYRRGRLYYTNPRHSRPVARMYIRQPSLLVEEGHREHHAQS